MATILFLVAALLHCSVAKVIYNYQGQAVVGMPESGQNGNVLRLEFNIAVARVPGSPDLLFQVDPTTIKVHNYTGWLFPVPESIMSIDAMTETIGRAESKANLATQLAKPILVARDENGTLSNIRHDTSDPYWSVNLKVGALSLFQLNVQADSGVYTVSESDITGNCPSTYLVQSREHYYGHDHSTPNFLNITKSRDYSKCTNRTILRHSFYSGVALSDEEFAEKNIISNAKFAYNISGTKAQGGLLLIESAAAEAQHIFTMFKPLSGSLTVFTHQRAVMIDRTSDTADVPAFDQMNCGWAQKFPNVITASPDWKLDDGEVVNQVREAVARLIDPDELNYMKGLYLNRIFERMRGAKLSAWESIGQAAAAAGRPHLKLLMDLAPSVGTLEGLQKFQEVLPRLTPNITAQFFAISGLHAEPTFQMLTTLRTICESPSVRETTREFKSCLLSFASMAYNRYFRSGYYLKNATFPTQETAAVAEIQTMVQRYYDNLLTGNVTTQLLWVKFAGNLGSPQTIPHLTAIASNENYPIVVRVHALRAFRRIPAAFHQQIQNNVLPIFTDWHNDVEVRIAAFRTIIASSPTQATIDLIAAALHQEPQEHVRSYVYTALTVLTVNPVVSDIPLSDRARIALQGLTNVIQVGMQYSHYKRIFDTYDDERNAGFTLDMSMVATPRSMMPREICFWARGVAFGIKANMFHFCLRLQGIQRALHKLFRTGGPVFPEFFAQLNLNQVDFEDYHGMADFSMEGHEMQFLEIPPIITQAMSDPAAMQQRLIGIVTMLRQPIMKTIVLDSTLQIPSLLGIPVQQNNTYVTQLNFSVGDFGLVPACRFNPYQPCQITMKPTGLYRVGSQHALGIDSGIVQSKVVLHGMMSRYRSDDRNWTISYSRNSQNMSFTFEANLPRTRTTTGHTEVIPLLVTVDRTQPRLANQFYVREVQAWHSMVLPDHSFNFALNNTAKLTGFLFGYNKTCSSCHAFSMLPAYKQAEPFCGKIVRDFYVIPQADAPDRFSFTYRHTGEQSSSLPSASFRSSDDAHFEFQHSMAEDLAQLKLALNNDMEELDELQNHMAANDGDEEQMLEEDTTIDRHRRSARWSRKDKKPGVSGGKKQRPESSDTDVPPQKTQITGQTVSNYIEIAGYRNGVVTRKIVVTSNRSPTGQPKQYQRLFTVNAVIGGRSIAAVCGKAIVQYPKNHIALLPGTAESEEPYWSYSSKMEYGQERCESDKSIELVLNFSRSAEQQLATRLFRARSPAARKWYTIYQTYKEIEQGITYGPWSRHLFHTLNEAHRLEIAVRGSDKSKMTIYDLDVRSWVSAFLLNVRKSYWKNLKSSFVRDVKHHEKEILFFGERNFQLPMITDFTIKTPETTNVFTGVHLRHYPLSLYFPLSASAMYYMSGTRLPGSCASQWTANGLYVSTFDNVIYNTTMPTCPDSVELNVLLAADCSSNSKFAVSGNWQSATKQSELRIATGGHSVVLKPSTKTSASEVHVDGTKVVDQLYQVKADDNGLTVKNRNNVITVQFDLGLYVTLTPDNAVIIALHPLYSGLTCGLCGDYNGQRLDEFTLADGTLTEDKSAFIASYVAGVQQCA